MISSIKTGTLWFHNVTRDTVVVVGSQRTGHQYDRYFQIEAVNSEGQILSLEDYVFVSEYSQTKEKKDD